MTNQTEDYSVFKSVYSQITNSNYRVKSLSSNENAYHSIKFMYINKKPRNFFATPPSTKVIGMKPSTSSNLGPGKYNTTNHSPTPSFEFKRSPRFSNSSEIASASIFKRLTQLEKEKINARIEKNKGIAVMSMRDKERIAHEKSIQNSLKGVMTRITKENILREKKLQKESVLKEKLKKYNYRQNIEVRSI